MLAVSVLFVSVMRTSGESIRSIANHLRVEFDTSADVMQNVVKLAEAIELQNDEWSAANQETLKDAVTDCEDMVKVILEVLSSLKTRQGGSLTEEQLANLGQEADMLAAIYRLATAISSRVVDPDAGAQQELEKMSSAIDQLHMLMDPYGETTKALRVEMPDKDASATIKSEFCNNLASAIHAADPDVITRLQPALTEILRTVHKTLKRISLPALLNLRTAITTCLNRPIQADEMHSIERLDPLSNAPTNSSPYGTRKDRYQ